MEDRFRFRAWDKKDKTMVYRIQNGLKFNDGSGSGIDFRYFLDHTGQQDSHEWELMQCIGSKDKVGQLIYEADVVQCCHWFFDGEEVDEHFKAHVGFKDGSFTLEGIKSKFYSNYTGEKDGTGICWIGSINFCDDNYEVIGNIYENPELLQQHATQ